MRINISTDWALGSSGAALVDEYGNAIGHVSTISIEGNKQTAGSNLMGEAASMGIIFHEATSARDVLALIRPVK